MVYRIDFLLLKRNNFKFCFIGVCVIFCGAVFFLSQRPLSSSTDCTNEQLSFSTLTEPNSLKRIYDFPVMEAEINFEDTESSSCPTTFVTVLYGKKSLDCGQNPVCKELVTNVASLNQCFVIFIDHVTKMDWVNSNKLKFIPITSHVSSMRADLSLQWNHFFEVTGHRSPQESYHRQWILNLKPWFLDISARMNVFDSTSFFWIDMDSFSKKPTNFNMAHFSPKLSSASVHLINTNPFDSGELHFGKSKQGWIQNSCRKSESHYSTCYIVTPRDCDDRISEKLFGGSSEAVRHWRAAYYTFVQESLSNRWFMGNHQNVIAATCLENPQLCSLTVRHCEIGPQDLGCLLKSFQHEFPRSWFHLHPIKDAEESWVAVEIGGQMGNQMFMLASSYGIAQTRKAKWCVSNLASSKYLKDFIWLTKPLPCPGWSWKIFNITGDSTFFVVSTTFTAANEGVGFARYTESILTSPHSNIFVGLFLQSHKYFNASGLPFMLRPHLAAKEWVDANKVTVGIHVRRGDKATDTGNVVTPLKYFFMAVKKMREVHGPDVSFVVCTDDKEWVTKQAPFRGMLVLSSQNPAFDMSVLAACKHRIMSIGTYGWWGTYLGDSPSSTNIYPVLQFTVPLIRGFSHSDYFPSHWIPIDYELDGDEYNVSPK